MTKNSPDVRQLHRPEQQGCLNITSSACRTVISDAIREEVGPGKRFDAEEAGEAVGVEKRTMRAYVAGDNLPETTTLIRMMRLFGLSFADRILGLAGMGGAHWVDQHEHVDDLVLNAETVDVISRVSDALRDGRIDHVERARIVAECRELIPVLEQFVAEHGGAHD